MAHTVLVTGGSGFVGSHVVLQLLQAGHRVRTTVRSQTREGRVREMIRTAGVSDATLSFFTADLDDDAGWSNAVAGCDYVIHVASPIPAAAPRREDELVRPARDGTLRVLRAAREAGVRRVVLTSSCGAVCSHQRGQCWRRLDLVDGEMSATSVESRACGLGLHARRRWTLGATAVIHGHPGAARAGVSSSIEPDPPAQGCQVSRLFFIVDVRDVADLHLRADHPPRLASLRRRIVLDVAHVSSASERRGGQILRSCRLAGASQLRPCWPLVPP